MEKRFLLKNKLKANLPPHEDVVAAFQGVVVKVVRVEAFCIFVKRLKLTLEGNMQEAGVIYMLKGLEVNWAETFQLQNRIKHVEILALKSEVKNGLQTQKQEAGNSPEGTVEIKQRHSERPNVRTHPVLSVHIFIRVPLPG